MSRLRTSRAAVIALLVGFAVSAALALIALGLYERNEKRLLSLRVREVSLVLGATQTNVETPLASAAALASATNGNATRFRELTAPEVGPGKQFGSLSLWPVGVAHTAPRAVAGATPAIAGDAQELQRLFGGSARPGVMHVVGRLSAAHPALGFELISAGPGTRFAVYGESPLPANRRSRVESNSAFSDLNYVLYLGRSRKPSDLLLTSLAHLPLTGRQASTSVPFGEGSFTLVVAPRGTLGGRFFRDLPIIIGVVGALLTLAAAVLIDRLARRRRGAEELAHTLDRVAAENRRLYVEQRGIAETLQHALLPASLPAITGLQVAARYVPASAASHVGGDWYDVVPLGEGQVAVLIGDVSGHGLEAATTMALVRHAALAYIIQDPRPATVLAKLARFVNSSPHAYFATVLCVLADVNGRRIAAASAGHLPPLVVQDGEVAYLPLSTGPPVGVSAGEEFTEETTVMKQHAALVAFTDGLVERRGEVLDVGLERLRESVAGQREAVDALLARLVSEFTSQQHTDDTAMVAIQWQT